MAYTISNAAAKVVNNNGGIVVDGSAVEGGYFVSQSIEITSKGEAGKIPDYACVEGALCYCTGDSKFYQYQFDGTEWKWKEKEFGTKVEASATNGKIKLNGTDTTVYTHATHPAKDKALYKVKVNSEGHVSDTDLVAKKDITDLGIPGQDTTYDLDASKNSGNGNVKINLTSSDTSSQPDSITIKGSGATTVTTDANGVITISSTDTTTQDGNDNQTIKGNGTAFGINDAVDIVGSGSTTVTADTTNKKITISSTDTNTWRKVQLEGVDKLGPGIDTKPLNIKAGSNVTITESNGTFTFSATDTNTDTNTAHTHTNGVGLVRTGDGGIDGTVDYKAKLQTETPLTIDAVTATETAGRVYPVVVDKSGNLAVNVPWTDTNTQDGNSAHSHGAGAGLAFDDTNRGGISGTVTYKANLKSETKLNTSDKVYPVALDADGYLAVNVPWENTQDGNDNDNQTVKTETVEFGANDPVTIKAGNNVTVEGDTNNKTITISSIDNDTKVTAVGNHYTPTADSTKTLSVDASSTTSATWGSTNLVTGVNIQRDAAGHVTGVTVDSIQMPANPNTDTAHTHEAGTGLELDNATGYGTGGTTGKVKYKAKLKNEESLGVVATATPVIDGRVYPVGVDVNGHLAVNIPWVNTQDGNDNQTVKVNVPDGTDVTFDINTQVEFVAGDNVTITGDANAKTITISASDTTYNVIDDLTTQDSLNPLSAKQGAVLNALIETLQGKFDKIIPTFVGTYAQYEAQKAEIPEGAIVVITDDDIADAATSSLLGDGVLGYLILG